jgi:hypothetical protein
MLLRPIPAHVPERRTAGGVDFLQGLLGDIAMNALGLELVVQDGPRKRIFVIIPRVGLTEDDVGAHTRLTLERFRQAI